MKPGMAAHFNCRRIFGYTLPPAGYVAARLLHNPNAADHRFAAWLLPIGCLAGAVLLLLELKQERRVRSKVAMFVGTAALAVAIFYGFVFLVLNDMMHR
jgi:hypothetical protein